MAWPREPFGRPAPEDEPSLLEEALGILIDLIVPALAIVGAWTAAGWIGSFLNG
jgi:hypothetical protein